MIMRCGPGQQDKTVIVVDDGLDTGSTMLAAVLAVGRHDPKLIDPEASRSLRSESGGEDTQGIENLGIERALMRSEPGPSFRECSSQLLL